MQDSLPAGWLAFAGRELNPLDRYERFPSCYISSPFPEFILTLDSLEHGGRLDSHGSGRAFVKLLTSVAPGGVERAFSRSSAMSMGSCENRITLYPAAPLRLATLLHARTIA
jgi:hypothetical protein